MDPTPSLHSRIADAFDDQELRALCFGCFPTIYREFAAGMTQGQMIQILLEHSVRHKAGDALLDALEQERPGLIGGDRDALLAWLDAARFDSRSGTTPGQVITIAGDQRNITTGGGDYAEGNIDKRQGVFVSGGTVHGNVASTNLGTVTANYYSQQATPITPALHQLRAPVGDFVGRAAEIAQIIQAVRQAIGSGAIAAISGVRGMGGIGKTELAYIVAHQLVSDFPDAQIVVDLRGASNPLTPIQALQTAIRAFEREARLGDDLAELQAIYRSLLSGKRVLILADDTRDGAQVRPLLPPMGCALLVTSRQRFALPGMHTIDLGTLAPKEAVDLLLRICPRIREAAPELAKLCGYLPLALRVSASLLASDATLAVARYLEQLADERNRLAALRDPDDPALDVGAVLALSYAALDSAAQATLTQLSLFVADFNLDAVQLVVIVEGAQSVETALSDLYRRSLLDYDAAQERYILHDLVRVFVRTHLNAEASEPLMLRYAQHYVQVADRAEKLYLVGGESVLAGLALFDRERAHIDATWAWARRQATGPAIDEVLISYARATVYIGDLRYDVRCERIPQFAAALAIAQQSGDHAVQSMALGNLGNAFYALGEVQRAIEYYQQSLSIRREIGDLRGEGAVLGNLGNAYADLGKLQQAIGYYQQNLAITREIGDRRGEGAALGNLGIAYKELGEVRQAIKYYQQSLSIRREMGDRRGEGQTLNNLGNAYYTLREVRRAIKNYEQWLVIAHEVGDQRGEAWGSWNLGELLTKHGEVARGVALMQVRVDYERSIGHANAEADAAYVEQLRQQLHAAEGAASPEGNAPADDPPA